MDRFTHNGGSSLRALVWAILTLASTLPAAPVEAVARSLEDLVRNRQIVGAQVVLGDVARVRLRRGRLEGRKIMGLEQWKEMTRPQSPRNDGGYGFGIGVRVNERGQAIVLSHGGALSGSYSHMIINLENGRYGVVTCSGLADQAKVAAIVATWVE